MVGTKHTFYLYITLTFFFIGLLNGVENISVIEFEARDVSDTEAQAASEYVNHALGQTGKYTIITEEDFAGIDNLRIAAYNCVASLTGGVKKTYRSSGGVMKVESLDDDLGGLTLADPSEQYLSSLRKKLNVAKVLGENKIESN